MGSEIQIKHLVIISPSFLKNEENEIVVPPLHLYLRQLRLLRPNLRISVIAIHYPFKTENYKIYGIDVYPCGAANGNLLTRPIAWRSAFLKIKFLNSIEPIDMIHSFWLNESTLLAQWLNRKYRVPHFCTLMGLDASDSNRYLKFIHLKSLKLIALSQFQKSVLQKNIAANDVQVIPWGIADFDIADTKNSTRPIDLLCVSSLIPLKRVSLFLNVVRKLKDVMPTIYAEVVGGGYMEAELQGQISSLGLTENVKLRGLLVRKETLNIIERTKALVHTSVYEAQGYVINEALAKGCEVFALSKGFIHSSQKLHLVDTEDELFEEIKKYLLSQNKSFNSQVPLTMLQTVEAYSAEFKKYGLHF